MLKKKTQNGHLIISRPRNYNYEIYDGLHKPIIDTKTWKLVQESRPYSKNNKYDTLICSNPKCDNISSKLYIVENKIIEALKIWLKNYKINYNFKNNSKSENNKILEKSITNIKKELEIEKSKLNKIYDFFENEIYNKDEFIIRSNSIKENIENLENKLEEYNNLLNKNNEIKNVQKTVIPKLENIIDLYYKLENAEDKNILLKSIIYKVNYLKTEKCIKKESNLNNFELYIYPKIPKI